MVLLLSKNTGDTGNSLTKELPGIVRQASGACLTSNGKGNGKLDWIDFLLTGISLQIEVKPRWF